MLYSTVVYFRKYRNIITFVQPNVLKESHSWRARPSRSRKVRNSPKEPRSAFLVTWFTIPLMEKQWDFVLRTQSILPDVRAQFEVDRRGDGAVARARVRAVGRNRRPNSPISVQTPRLFVRERPHSAFSSDFRWDVQTNRDLTVKILAVLLFRTTRIVLDEIRKLLIMDTFVEYTYVYNTTRTCTCTTVTDSSVSDLSYLRR